MPAHSFSAPRPRRSPTVLAALDFGLPVRVSVHGSQPTLFSKIAERASHTGVQVAVQDYAA